MRPLSVIIWLFSFIFCHAEQTTDPQPKEQKAIFSGEIAGMADSALVVYVSEVRTENFEDNSITHSAVLKNGKFRFEFEIARLSRVYLAHETTSFRVNFVGQNIVYLEPGDSIHVVIPGLDSPMVDDVQYYGKGSEKHVLLKELGVIYKEHAAALKGTKPSFEDKLAFTATLQAKVRRFLYGHRDDFSEEVFNAIYRARSEAAALSFANHFFGSRQIDDDVKKDLYARCSREFVRDTVNFITRVALGGYIPVLLDLALLKYQAENAKAFDRSQRKRIDRMYPLLVETFQSHPALDIILARYIAFSAKLYNWNTALQNVATDFFDRFPSGEGREIVERTRAKFVENIERPFSYDFSLRDTLGREVKLARFAGQVLFIDFMYNGCVGCYHAAPQIEELEAEFKGQNIAFISVSIDKTLEQFKAGIGKFSSKGSLSLYTNGHGSNHPLIDHFDIIGYPTLVLIDKNGRLLSRRTGLRPPVGKKELAKLITKALQD